MFRCAYFIWSWQGNFAGIAVLSAGASHESGRLRWIISRFSILLVRIGPVSRSPIALRGLGKARSPPNFTRVITVITHDSQLNVAAPLFLLPTPMRFWLYCHRRGWEVYLPSLALVRIPRSLSCGRLIPTQWLLVAEGTPLPMNFNTVPDGRIGGSVGTGF